VEAAEQAWRPLGELLLSKNLIARAELDVALAEQEETGKLLGAILVDRGFISGPALAIALAEQYGVELDQQQGFGTGLWAEIERRHRSERGISDPDERQVNATIVKFEPPHMSLEVVPDPEPEPDAQLERLEEENRLLQEEIARLHTEFTQLRVIEPEPDPELERLEEENRRLQGEVEGLSEAVARLQVPDPHTEAFEAENHRLQKETERLEEENRRLQGEVEGLREAVAQLQVPDPHIEELEAENKRLQEEIERLHSEFTRLRVIEAERVEPEPEPELPKTHVLFVPTPTRYLLLERQGPPPDAGTELSLSEGSFVVGKVGRAPVPGERRACAFLLARA
jgi:archaellum component FlaC